MASKTTDWRPGPTVCRCCLTEGCYKDISTEYFWMGKREVYAEMLSETFSLSIAYSQSGGPNSNSRLICEPCISRLRDASDFRRQVQECEKTFTQYLDPATAVVELDAPLVTADAQVKVERVKIKKEASDDDFDDRPDFNDADDDDDDDLDDQPLTKLASKVPKKESVDLMDLLDNAKAGEKRKSTTKTKTPAAKKAKGKKEAKATTSKAPKPEKKKKGVASASGRSYKVVNIPIVELLKSGEKEARARRTSAVAIIHSTNACPFKYHRMFMCFFCRNEYRTMVELMAHTSDQHHSTTESDIRQAIIKLGKRQPIKINIPNCVCKLCNEDLISFEELKHHLANKHKKSVEPKLDGVLPYKITGEEFACALCEKTFLQYRHLNSHINVHCPNFVCEQCGVGFASDLRLRAHVSSHETGQFPCEQCGKVFSKLYTKIGHVKSVHMKEKRNKCTLCMESFRDFYQKQKHLLTVHGMEKNLYKCKYCERCFVTSSNLRTHEKQNHLKNVTYSCDLCDYKSFNKYALTRHLICHTTERNFKCEVCKKCYARQRTLTEHMKIHNNDRRFACSYCDRAFVQKCSLKSHIRTHHKDIPDAHC